MSLLMDRIRELHSTYAGTAPTNCGEAPGTWPVIGEHTDALGAMVVLGTTSQTAAVALSPNTTATVHVRVFDAFSDAPTHEEEIPWNTVGQQVTDPSTAQRLGLLIWNMIHSQLITKEFAGVDISILNTVPLGMALGETYAVDAALARALAVEMDPPTLFRFAQACSTAISNYTNLPSSRARHLVSIRSQEGLHALDYKDGALTTVPRPAITAVCLPTPPNHDVSDKIRVRNDFCHRMIESFGVDSLTSLPDYESRVPRWLQAVHNNRDFPPLEECLRWCNFYFNEIKNCATVVGGFRSRGLSAPLQAMDDSNDQLHELLGLPHSPIADHAKELGATAVRGTVAYCEDEDTAARIVESLHSIGLEAFVL